jgi:hypothetical protein
MRCEHTGTRAFPGSEQQPHLLEKRRSASICLSRFPFLAVFSWHSFGLNSCALRTAALCFALLSFTFVPDARPSGFGTPGKISTFRNSSSRNLTGPSKKARLVLGSS